jgi:hypothetical protein
MSYQLIYKQEKNDVFLSAWSNVPRTMINGFCMHGTINKNMCVLFSDENDLLVVNSILGSLE